MTIINIAQNIFAQQLHGTLMGPALVSEAFVEAYGTTMTIVECEVSNGATIERPLPFGMFATIERQNLNKARLIAMFAPGFVGSVPQEDAESTELTTVQFSELCAIQRDINEYICSATVCEKIVPIGDTPESGTNIWSSKIDPIDETHGRRTTIKNVVLSALTGQVFDDQFNQYVNTRRELVQALGSSNISVANDLATHVYYTPYKCGWWIKHTDTFVPSAMEREFWTQENFYWPPVLRELELMEWVARSQRNAGEAGSSVIAPRLFFNPEGYEGLCNTKVELSWSLTVAESAPPEKMQPQRIYYACPAFTLNCPECLHPYVELWCDYGTTDEQFMPSFDSRRSFPATNHEEWPDSIVGQISRQSYRGGYMTIKKTYYPPPHDTSHTSEWLGWNIAERPNIHSIDYVEISEILRCETSFAPTGLATIIARQAELSETRDFSDPYIVYGSSDENDPITWNVPAGTYYIRARYIYINTAGFSVISANSNVQTVTVPIVP